MAAEQGHASAQFYLGFKYNEGEGVQEDDTEALMWFLRAGTRSRTGQTRLDVRFRRGRARRQRRPSSGTVWLLNKDMQTHSSTSA